MPDHLHLLLRLNSGSRSLGDVIGSFKRSTTRESWQLGFSGQLWQKRFYDHVLRGSEQAERVANYILENPVRRGLVTEANRYPYSAIPDPI